jgi:hypothetical protein
MSDLQSRITNAKRMALSKTTTRYFTIKKFVSQRPVTAGSLLSNDHTTPFIQTRDFIATGIWPQKKYK